MSNPYSPPTSLAITTDIPTHRQRISACRLSSDTMSTLPEYMPTSDWSQGTTAMTPSTTTTTGTGAEIPSTSRLVVNQEVEPPLDLPPDYPDSAEEADEDTDDDGDATLDGNSYGHLRHLRQKQQREEYVPQFTAGAGPHHAFSRAAHRTNSPKKLRKNSSRREAKLVGATAALKSPLLPLPTQSPRTSPLPSPKSTDLLLDSLLERSVHALEMSNALLHSSMNTRSTSSTLCSAGTGSNSDSGLPPQSRAPKRVSVNHSAVGSDEQYEALQSRIKTWRNGESWAGDPDEIKRGVCRPPYGGDVDLAVDGTEVEVGQDPRSNRQRRELEREARRSENSTIESSLERSTFSSRRHPHERSASSPSNHPSIGEDNRGPAPQLRFEQHHRERLVAHPSRAVTQDVEATSDADTTASPSTLGSTSMSTLHRVTPERTDVTRKKGAYNMLSSLAFRSTGSASSMPSSPTLTSPKKELTHSLLNGKTREQHLPYKRRYSTSPTRSSPWAGILGRSQSEAHKQAVGRDRIINRLGPSRRTTLPIESLSSPSQSSTSSSEDDEVTILGGQKRKLGPSAKRTVLELRRILDEQPSRQREAKFNILRPPALLQKVGGSGTAAEAGTSNATASVSRLLTKNKHSSSTRPPSPPRQSALKGRSMPGTPISRPVTPPTSCAVEAAIHAAQATAKPSSDSLPESSAFRIPQALTSFAKSALLAKAKGERLKSALFSSPTWSPSGSGASTPRRISFAELPESYSSGRRKSKISRKSKNRRRKKRNLSDTDAVEDEGWLRWLVGGSVPTRHYRMGSDGMWGDEP
ncbi:hypothetical protein L218DRAFT_996943 [Marasmius fiardii PR-910]|nr:hypothetical protein L218DRAFT_996943 [Marasmius fiardii PR-910]